MEEPSVEYFVYLVLQWRVGCFRLLSQTCNEATTSSKQKCITSFPPKPLLSENPKFSSPNYPFQSDFLMQVTVETIKGEYSLQICEYINPYYHDFHVPSYFHNAFQLRVMCGF